MHQKNGPKTLGVEGTPQEDESRGVIQESNIVRGGDRPGRGGDKNSPDNQSADEAGTKWDTSPEYGIPETTVHPATQANKAVA